MSERETVEHIMNHEVYAVATDEIVGEVLGMILTLGITAAPVVDEAGEPLGLVSLRNLARAPREDPIAKHMTTPVHTVAADTSITEAGREMGQLAYHHLVVVDEAGKVVGFVSSLDVVRGLVGLPAAHPPAFPHQEPESGMSWSPNLPLSAENLDKLRAGPGMLVLSRVQQPDEVLWAEASSDVAARLQAIARGEHGLPAPVRERLEQGEVAFRVAAFAGGKSSKEGAPSVIDVLLTRSR